jgi:hypothetical protein
LSYPPLDACRARLNLDHHGPLDHSEPRSVRRGKVSRWIRCPGLRAPLLTERDPLQTQEIPSGLTIRI